MKIIFEMCLHFVSVNGGKVTFARRKRLTRIGSDMTKADVVCEISRRTGIDRATALTAVEALMAIVKDSLKDGESVYLRGFGSFVVKQRAAKTARNITKNTTIIIPKHAVPAFKPSKIFIGELR